MGEAPAREGQAGVYLMFPSWLCPNGNHVFTWTSSSTRPDSQPSGYCQCGVAYYDTGERRITMMFPPHVTINPFAPSKSTPPTLRPGSGCTAADLPDVPASRLGAAQDAGAGWLSADGLIAYTVRYGRVLQADWDGARFGGWLDIGEEMPADAVKM